jgi:hypothetical protein
MNFSLPYFKVGPVPITMLEQTDELIKSFETNHEYNFKLKDWLRIDSYNNPNNFQLTDLIGHDLQNHVMKFFPDHKLFGWSISHLPAKKDIIDHADRMLFHRFAKRIIVITSKNKDVLNWHWAADKKTKRPYIFDYGNIYRLNTAVTHGVHNYSNEDRRGVYFDMMPTRLYEKFKNHNDLLKVILTNATGEKYVL